MRFTITSHGTDRPLEIDIFGYHLEVSGMDSGSISISDSDGRVSVRYVELESVATEQVAPVDSIDALQVDLPVIEAGQNSSSLSKTKTLVNDSIHNLDSIELTDSLFTHLVSLRKQIAVEVNLPPYIIFHDSTLRDMCRLLPSDLEELMAVQGVGQAKLEKYGLRFIQAIHEFVSHIKEAS